MFSVHMLIQEYCLYQLPNKAVQNKQHKCITQMILHN